MNKKIWIGCLTLFAVVAIASVTGWAACSGPLTGYQQQCRRLVARFSPDPALQRDRERLAAISGYLGHAADELAPVRQDFADELRIFQANARRDALALGISDADLAKSIAVGVAEAKSDVQGNIVGPMIVKLMPLEMEIIDIGMRQGQLVVRGGQ
jgi:hypothetical protein